MFVNLCVEGHLIQKVVHLSHRNKLLNNFHKEILSVYQICECVKSTFLTVNLFDRSAVRSCNSGPILWGNIPTALSRIIPNPMFGFWIQNLQSGHIVLFLFVLCPIVSSAFSFLTISQKTSGRLGAERTSQAASIRWEHCVATPSVWRIQYDEDMLSTKVTNIKKQM